MSFDEKVMWRPERVFPLTEKQTKWTSVFILYGLAVEDPLNEFIRRIIG